jgi:hypothetical protein
MTIRLLLLGLLLGLAVPAGAQETPETPGPEAPPAPPAAEPASGETGGGDPPDDEIDPADPDFGVVALPTAVRVAKGGVVFRLTHRFSRPLNQGDFSELAADLFGFDSGAQVGIELRYGIVSRLQAGVYRTSDRTIQLFAMYDFAHAASHAVGVALMGTVEGLDNFSEDFAPGASLVVSRRLGTRGTLYAVPTFVANTNVDDTTTDDDGTFYLGLGARVRLGESWAVLAEFSPRLAGYQPLNPISGEEGRHQLGFAIERRVGGHAFQINVQNSLGTTPGQIARGGPAGEDWYLGFNLSRRFF